MKTPITARAAAVLYAFWGLAHLAGGIYQLLTLRQGGALALAGAISTAAPLDGAGSIPRAAAAFMGMGAANIAVAGALVTGVAFLNWRNSRLGYWINLLLVGGVDLDLVAFLLVPGVMSWGDGMIGLGLFLPAAALSTAARLQQEGGPSRLVGAETPAAA